MTFKGLKILCLIHPPRNPKNEKWVWLDYSNTVCCSAFARALEIWSNWSLMSSSFWCKKKYFLSWKKGQKSILQNLVVVTDFLKVFTVALRTPAIMLAPLNFQRLILNPLRRKMGKICTSRILPKRNSFRQFQKIQRYLNSFCERLYSLHRAIDKR